MGRKRKLIERRKLARLLAVISHCCLTIYRTFSLQNRSLWAEVTMIQTTVTVRAKRKSPKGKNIIELWRRYL
jgi:hypothetical protein